MKPLKSIFGGSVQRLKAFLHHRRTIESAGHRIPPDDDGQAYEAELTPSSPTFTLHNRKSLPQIPAIVDEEVSINIKIDYNDELLDKTPSFRVRWLDPKLSTILEDKVESCLRECKLIPEATQLHRETGRCSLIRQTDQKVISTTVWKNEEQNEEKWMEEMTFMIMDFCRTQNKVPFFLNIHWGYVDPLITEVDGERYVTTVYKALTRKMTKNWEGTEYISQSNLVTILSKNTIALLVDRDLSLLKLGHVTSESSTELQYDRNRFIEDIDSDGVHLLALHVWTDTPLLCLFKMMKQGFLDSDMRKRPLAEKDCPCDEYLHTFKTLVMLQGTVMPHQFAKLDRLPTHDNLHNKTVVPIKEHGEIGKGGFGKVFKVSVETGHHFFPCDNTSNYFAMKVFYGFGEGTEAGFNRESKMLQTLAEFPHSHITRHLASWTQRGKFYMLFPLAKLNLRLYLQNTPALPLNKDFMLWLISQLAGLADGVRTIHNLAPARLGPALLEKPTSGKGRIGFHHDLKPDNILLFETQNAGQEIMSISDFGSAKVSQMLSGAGTDSRRSYRTPGQSPGDPVYGAPETEANEGTSRPYDIWSLGCIFFEILMWVFRFDLRQFALDRVTNSRLNTIRNPTPAFWYKSSENEVKLKPAVAQRLKELVEHCKNRGVFEELVSIVRRMLSMSPGRRITAAEVWSALDGLRMSVEVELREDPEAYLKIGKHTMFAAPPSNAVDNLSSIDDIETANPPPSQLSPNGLSHRRTTSDGKLVRRSSDRNSSSDLDHLRIDTDLPVAKGRSRSPSIAISHVDDPLSVIDGMDELEGYENVPLVGAHSYTWGRDDFTTGRPPSARSRRSFSEGDVPLHPSTWEENATFGPSNIRAHERI